MTVASDTAKIRHAGNGATFTFSTGFAFLSNDHVRVILLDAGGTETEWTENTEYSLTGANTGSPGTVTVSTAPTDYTPATGETLVIMRDVPFTQDLDASVLSTMAASELEAAFDKAWQALGQLKEKLDRALVTDDTAAAGLPTVAAWTPVLAIVTDGARRVQQVVNWVGGAGTMPATGQYVGAGGLVDDIGDAVDIRGPAGASGAGTGDMLAANNLSDVLDVPTARTSLGLGTMATETAANYLTKAGNLGGVADAATARSNLGLGSAATMDDTDFAQTANNLSDMNAASMRTNLGLGTAAVLDVGATANKVVQLNASAQLPAVSGELLTNLPASGQPIPTSSTYGVGTLLLAAVQSGSVVDGSTIAGSSLKRIKHNATTDEWTGSGVVLTGTWKNVSGDTLTANGDPDGGYFVRTA